MSKYVRICKKKKEEKYLTLKNSCNYLYITKIKTEKRSLMALNILKTKYRTNFLQKKLSRVEMI